MQHHKAKPKIGYASSILFNNSQNSFKRNILLFSRTIFPFSLFAVRLITQLQSADIVWLD